MMIYSRVLQFSRHASQYVACGLAHTLQNSTDLSISSDIEPSVTLRLQLLTVSTQILRKQQLLLLLPIPSPNNRELLQYLIQRLHILILQLRRLHILLDAL
jgi:hypothetical protein